MWGFLLFVLFFGAFLFDASQTPKGERGLAASTVIEVQRFLQDGVIAFTGEVSDHLYAHKNALESQKEVGVLKRRLARMGQMKAEMAQLREENRLLRRWSHFPSKQERFFPLGANVIGRKISQLGRILRIDQGKIAGLQKGDGVVNVDHQVVGRILWVSDTTSDVMLVTDPASSIDGVIERSRARGLVRGMGKSDLVVEDLDRLMDVQENDTILTAGTNKDFPKGLPIAQVKTVIPPREGVYLKAEMIAVANLRQLESVWVLRRVSEQKLPRLGQELVETIAWPPQAKETHKPLVQAEQKEEVLVATQKKATINRLTKRSPRGSCSGEDRDKDAAKADSYGNYCSEKTMKVGAIWSQDKIWTRY